MGNNYVGHQIASFQLLPCMVLVLTRTWSLFTGLLVPCDHRQGREEAQDEDFETPMQPITMMRNALGKDEGGSGVPLDRAKYEASTAYWESRAAIVAGDSPSGE